MKALFLLLLFVGIFGAAAYFGNELYLKPKKLAEAELAQGTAALPPDPSLPDFAKCVKLKEEKKLIDARAEFEAFLENFPNSTKLEEAKGHLGEINAALFLTNLPSPDKLEHTIRSGDTLIAIAKKYRTSQELITRANGTDDPTKLKLGAVLQIPQADFSMTISRKEKKVILLNHGKFFKQYAVQKWNVPAAKNSAPLTGKVAEKSAWLKGKPVAFGSKEFHDAAQWTALTVRGYTIYAEPPDPSRTVDKPPSGLAVAFDDAAELGALVIKGTPVTIE